MLHFQQKLKEFLHRINLPKIRVHAQQGPEQFHQAFSLNQHSWSTHNAMQRKKDQHCDTPG